MADHTITISNTITVIGGKPARFWGVMIWGTDTWGWKGDFQEIQVGKSITNSLTLNDPAFIYSVSKLISESITPSDAISEKAATISISESLSLAADPSVESLQDPAGYFYVFTKPTTNSDERANTSYTSGSVATASFTSQAQTSTVWS